ncbi:hypothetical protein IAR50_000133 [Cryptococcus sp. DSM 104548]
MPSFRRDEYTGKYRYYDDADDQYPPSPRDSRLPPTASPARQEFSYYSGTPPSARSSRRWPSRRRNAREHADWEYSQIDEETNKIVRDVMPEIEHYLARMSIGHHGPGTTEFDARRTEIATSIAHQVKSTLQTEVSRRKDKEISKGDMRDVQFRTENITLNEDGTELILEGVSIYGSGWSTRKREVDMVFFAEPDDAGDDNE